MRTWFSIALTLTALLAWSAAFAGTTPWIDFKMSGGHIVMDVEIDGRPSIAILDTGADGFGIDEKFLSEHGRHFKRGMKSDKVLVSGIAGTFTKHPVYDVPIKLFDAEFNLDYVVPIRLGRHDILIGREFFEFSIAQIDYPNQRMRLITRDAMQLKKFANVKLRRPGHSGGPLIKVELNDDTEQWLMLDTGATGGLFLPRWLAEKNGWLEKYPSVSGHAVGISGIPVQTDNFILPKIKLGPYTVEDVEVSVPADNERNGWGSRGPGEPDTSASKGLIGYDVLKHFVFTMDIKKKQLHVGLSAE